MRKNTVQKISESGQFSRSDHVEYWCKRILGGEQLSEEINEYHRKLENDFDNFSIKCNLSIKDLRHMHQ